MKSETLKNGQTVRYIQVGGKLVNFDKATLAQLKAALGYQPAAK